jgi:dsDNA-binding SOS-regulon protein
MSYTNKSFQDVYNEMLDLAGKISYRWNPKESNESIENELNKAMIDSDE